jgi:hypothetical protein
MFLTQETPTFSAPGKGLRRVFKICFTMADTRARIERLHRCNTAWGNIEPIIHHHRASAEMEEEEDLESSYVLSERMESLHSYTATATSRARSGSQLTPV